MPALVFNEMRFEEKDAAKSGFTPKETPANAKKDTARPVRTPLLPSPPEIARRAALRRWMWVAVLSISSVIGVLWLWSLTNHLTGGGWRRSMSEEVAQKNQANWDLLWKQLQKDRTDTTTQTSREAKEALIALLTTNARTTTVTATPSSTRTFPVASSTTRSTTSLKH